MTEFDDLLNEVLHRDVNVEPPAGMEGRTGAVLAAALPGQFTKRGIWVLAALAAMLAVVAGAAEWMHSAPRTPSRTDTIATQSAARSSAFEISVGRRRQLSPTRQVKRAVRSLPTKHLRSGTQIGATPVVRLESLVIPALEIASLKFDSTNQGEIR